MSSEESNYIDIHGLGAEISARIGIPQGDAEAFVLALTRLFHDEIGENGEVELPGLGFFRYLGNGRMEFKPSDKLALKVNSTFSMFSPVELPEGSEEIFAADVKENDVTENIQESEPEPETPETEHLPEAESSVKTVEEVVVSEQPAEPEEVPQKPESPSPEYEIPVEPSQEYQEPECEAPIKPTNDYQEPEYPQQEYDAPAEPEYQTSEYSQDDFTDNYYPEDEYSEVKHHGKRLPSWLFYILGIATGIAVAACIWFFYYSDYATGRNDSQVTRTDSINVAQMNVTRLIVNGHEVSVQDTIVADSFLTNGKVSVDKTKAEEQAEAPKVITDTITSRKFLTTLAKKHFGKKNYWVFIYEENKSKLRHPDRISPGTVVVIPPLEKYVKPGSSEDSIKRATSRLTGEIYRRYK